VSSRGLIDLSGTRAVITGSSRGIGAACARLFSAAGAAVVVQYRHNRAEAERVLASLPAPRAGAHLLVGCELARPEEVQALFRAVRENWGGLDCLVNNAGIWVHNPLSSFDPDKLSETWAVNVTAPFLCACEALPLFAGAADPNIVNLTSTAGQRGEAFYSPYAASKGAMISATKAWSTELGPGVRVNSVAPGWVDTDMSAGSLRDDREQRAAIEASIPLRRVASAEDIAGAVLFLASSLARHITGEILNVNGGSVLVG
jgi:3-oxoacyl-[acyl-carrier protein] reductase